MSLGMKWKSPQPNQRAKETNVQHMSAQFLCIHLIFVYSQQGCQNASQDMVERMSQLNYKLYYCQVTGHKTLSTTKSISNGIISILACLSPLCSCGLGHFLWTFHSILTFPPDTPSRKSPIQPTPSVDHLNQVLRLLGKIGSLTLAFVYPDVLNRKRG